MPIKDPEKKRAYQRDWTQARRDAWFLGRVCVECGSRQELQLHHKIPALKVSHKIWSWSEGRRTKELTFCQALCRNCHLKATRRQNGYGQVHGTATSYQYYRCRCKKCTRAAVARVNEWRWRTGKRKQRSQVV